LLASLARAPAADTLPLDCVGTNASFGRALHCGVDGLRSVGRLATEGVSTPSVQHRICELDH
jgi:hypothetical protein